MVIKVYYSGISSSPEIRSYQQRAQFILDSLRVDYDSVDVTDPFNEDAKDMIKEKCKHRNDQPPKTPQFFNDDVYCGDWFDFEIASDEDRILEWLGLEDNREEEQAALEANAKEIEGNETEDNNQEVNNTENQTIKTEIKDGILTTETVTKEEQIIFSKQNVKSAPISVRLDETTGKEIIEFKDENAVVEEETVPLEIIKGEEEVTNRVIESTKDENLDNGEVYENGTGEEDEVVEKSEEEEEKNESENEENESEKEDEPIDE